MYVQTLYSFYGHFLVNMFFGCNPPRYTSRGRLIGKSLQINRKIDCTLLFYFLLQALLFSEPVIRPALSPRTYREALRMPRIDFRSQRALQSRALSKCIELYGRAVHDCSGILTRGLWDCWPNWERAVSSPRSCSRAGTGAGEHPLSQRRQQLHTLVLLPLIYSPAFVFTLSLPAGFPSDPSLLSSAHSIGWAGD